LTEVSSKKSKPDNYFFVYYVDEDMILIFKFIKNLSYYCGDMQIVIEYTK